MNYIILLLKGVLVGIGKIIPGVSGALIAISLNIYEKCIEIISHPFKKTKENLLFITPILLGIIISLVFFSKTILFLINNYYLWTMLLFIGLIAGSAPGVIKEINYKKGKNILITGLSLIIFVFLMSIEFQENINENVNLISLLFIGLIEAITIVVPGISGTAILMTLGYYKYLLNLISGITTNFSTAIYPLIPIAVSLIIGIIIMSKIMNKLFNEKKEVIYAIIFGCLLSSILLLFKMTLNNDYNFIQISIGLFLMLIGYKLSLHFS